MKAKQDGRGDTGRGGVKVRVRGESQEVARGKERKLGGDGEKEKKKVLVWG